MIPDQNDFMITFSFYVKDKNKKSLNRLLTA